MTYKWPSAAERDAIEHFVKIRPLDTSTLGPIRVEPNAIAERARVVREALRHIACDPTCAELPFQDRELAWGLCTAGADETLAKLGRLLR